MPCAICKTAKAKRFCPGVREEICPACCGAGREQSIDCPIDCEFLAEAHKHEKKPATEPAQMPGQDVPLEDEFLRANEFMIVLVGSAMCEGFRSHPNALDADAKQALEALADERRTLIAGIFVDKTPVNPIAAAMYDKAKARIDDIAARMLEADSTKPLPDAVVLGVLVFLQRVAFGLNNGRAKCKAFLVFLSQFYVDMKADEENAGNTDAADAPLVTL